ncbi:MAG: hypothetical protein AABZ10_04095 [Nitrospirota bacterium]|mgnify:CR=1 FL=1
MIEAETINVSHDVPLTDFGIPIRNLWHMLLYAWNEPEMLQQCEFEVESAPSLDALLAAILVKIMQQRMRIGLGCSYVNEEVFLRGLRGRIDFAYSLKSRAFERGQAYCRFQQYKANAPKNQIIRSTLARLIQIGNFGPDQTRAEELRHKLRRLTRDLEGIDLIDIDLEFIRRQKLGRNDSDYRLMLAICELILQRQMPTETEGRNKLPALDRDALTLHYVYEKFVANFYKLHLHDWSIKPQSRFDWHASKTSIYLPSMQPDLVMQHNQSGRLVILDTKFTPNSLVNGRFGEPKFDSSHIYQLYAYLRSQETLSEQHRVMPGILLYPAARYNLSEAVELQGHEVRFETVDLALPWVDIGKRLMDLVADPI